MWAPLGAAGGEGTVRLEPPALSPMETPPPHAQNQTLGPGRGTATNTSRTQETEAQKCNGPGHTAGQWQILAWTSEELAGPGVGHRFECDNCCINRPRCRAGPSSPPTPATERNPLGVSSHVPPTKLLLPAANCCLPREAGPPGTGPAAWETAPGLESA